MSQIMGFTDAPAKGRLDQTRWQCRGHLPFIKHLRPTGHKVLYLEGLRFYDKPARWMGLSRFRNEAATAHAWLVSGQRGLTL